MKLFPNFTSIPFDYLLQLFRITRDLRCQKHLWLLDFSATSIKIIMFFAAINRLREPLRKQKFTSTGSLTTGMPCFWIHHSSHSINHCWQYFDYLQWDSHFAYCQHHDKQGWIYWRVNGAGMFHISVNIYTQTSRSCLKWQSPKWILGLFQKSCYYHSKLARLGFRRRI